MSVSALYGRIVTGTAVRKAVGDTIRLWSPSYLAEIGAQAGRERDALPLFRSYRSSAKGFKHWPEDQLPACIIMVGKINPDSIEKHDGKYSAEWPVGIGLVCSAMDQDSTNELVELYTGAVRALIAQHASLGGFASQTEWVGESYDELPYEDSRSLAGGTVNLGVSVDAVLDSAAGLAEPPTDPGTTPAEPPVVETTGTTTSAAPPFTQEIDI